jgi:hypothetical protein
MSYIRRENAQLLIKRSTNIFAYIETQTKGILTLPSIGKEQVSTVAKPELKVAVIISVCMREIAVKYPQNRIDNGKKRVAAKMLM